MTDTPEPPPAPSHPAPEPAPQAQAAPSRPMPWLVIGVIAAIVVVLVGGGFAYQAIQQQRAAQEAFTVQPFTPTTELITAHDRVEAHATPSTASPIALVYGDGVTLNVNGRVQRGLGDDWYAVAYGEETVFVRVGDTVAGSGAPPVPEVRERPPQVIEEEDKEPEKPSEEAFPDAPPVASGGMLEISQVGWVREPNARDFARYYPNGALDRGQSGNVTLDCLIGGNGRLDCSVMSENPPGEGFGRAAMSISRQLRVRSTLSDGSPAGGRHLRLPLSFRAR